MDSSYQLSLNQLNFEGNEIPEDDDELNAFSNLVSFDSEFKEKDSGALPILAKKFKKKIGRGRNAADDLGFSHHRDHEEREHFLGGYYSSPQSNASEGEIQEVMDTEEVGKQNDTPSSRSSFDSFTDTVEALALQKSVIGNSSVEPASAEEIAKAIAAATNKLSSADNSLVEQTTQNQSFDTVDGSTPQQVVNVQDDDSLLISMTQEGQYDLVMTSSDGTTVTSDGTRVNEIESPKQYTEKSQPPIEPVVIDTKGPATPDELDRQIPPPIEPPPPPKSDNINSDKNVKSKRDSTHSKAQKHKTVTFKEEAQYLEVANTQCEYPQMHTSYDQDYSQYEHLFYDRDTARGQQNGVSSAGDSYDVAGHAVGLSRYHKGNQELIKVPSEDIVIEKKSSSWFSRGDSDNVNKVVASDKTRVNDNNQAQVHHSSKTAKQVVKNSNVVDKNNGVDSSNGVDRNSAMQSHNMHPPQRGKHSSRGKSKKELEYEDDDFDVDLSTPGLASGKVATEEEIAKHNNPLGLEDEVKSIPLSTSSPVANVGKFNPIAQEEIQKLKREKAQLEGKLEVLELEAKASLQDRAALQSQVAALNQQIKSDRKNAERIVGEKHAATADMDTLRQNKARLEQVIVDTQRLIDDKDEDIKNLQGDLENSNLGTKKLQDTIKDLKQSLTTKEGTVEDMKSKISELYVQFQTTNQTRILLENEIKSLQSEINTLKSGKNWYQDQLQGSQDSKSRLQQEVTKVKGELIAQGTFIERLKTENSRIKQHLTETQQRMIQEKELLARHLEAIEADMLEREAAFEQLQKEKEQYEMSGTKDGVVSNEELDYLRSTINALESDLRKSKNELRQKSATVSVMEHEQAELNKRITLCQESLVERDRNIDTIETKLVDSEVQLRNVQLQLSNKEEDYSKLKQEKSLVEVELSSLKEEKKTFDYTLQMMKQDMGKVERSFKVMSQELATKNEELRKLKSEKDRKNEELARQTQLESKQKSTENTEIIKESTPPKDVDSNKQVDAATVESLNTVKSEKAALEQELMVLKQSSRSEVGDLKNNIKFMETEMAKLKKRYTMLKGAQQLATVDKDGLQKELVKSMEKTGDLETQLQNLNLELQRVKQEAASKPKISGDDYLGHLSTENDEMKIMLTDIQRQSHREIAKLKAKNLKLTKELETTSSGKDEQHRQLSQQIEDLTLKLRQTEETKGNLTEEVSALQRRSSLELDDQTTQIADELHHCKEELSKLKEENLSIHHSLSETTKRYEDDVVYLKNRLNQSEAELRTLVNYRDNQRENEEAVQTLTLELEKERGRLSGLVQSMQGLKDHAADLENQLANRASSSVENSAAAQDECMKRDNVIEQLRKKIEEVNGNWEKEKQTVKDIKKMLMTEKGGHVKTRRKMESMWVEHDQMRADLDQKTRDLELSQNELQALKVKEAKAKLETDTAGAELRSLRVEIDRLRTEARERESRDPVLQEHIRTLEWQLQEKQKEIEAMSTQLTIVEERQKMEVESVRRHMMTQTQEVSSLREELSVTKRDKAGLQSKLLDMKSALKATVNHHKLIQDKGEGQTQPPLDMDAIDKLLTDSQPPPQSKPLSFLQSTLSELRGEITSLQDQMKEHEDTVHDSSQAWKELEAQVRDLREVCKSSAADREASLKLLKSPGAPGTDPNDPTLSIGITLPSELIAKYTQPKSSAASMSSGSPQPTGVASPKMAGAASPAGAKSSPTKAKSFINTHGLTPNAVYRPGIVPPNSGAQNS